MLCPFYVIDVWCNIIIRVKGRVMIKIRIRTRIRITIINKTCIVRAGKTCTYSISSAHHYSFYPQFQFTLRESRGIQLRYSRKSSCAWHTSHVGINTYIETVNELWSKTQFGDGDISNGDILVVPRKKRCDICNSHFIKATNRSLFFTVSFRVQRKVRSVELLQK